MADLTSISALIGIPWQLLILVIVWSAIWKGIALWKSARKNHLIWFIVLLVVNTLGILEILYVFLFSKINLNKGGIGGSRRRKKSR